MKAIFVFACTCATFALVSCAGAQMIEVGMPLNNVNDSYFERMGVGFGFQFAGGRGPGSRVVGLLPNGQVNPTGALVFGQNGVGSAIPPFGGFDPNAQGTFGFGTRDRDGNGFSLGLFMGKGNSRSNVSTTPSVVLQNGQLGSVFSGQVSPFVTGIQPILGGSGFQQPVIYRRYARPSQSTEEETAPTESAATYSDANSSAQYGDLSVSEIKRQREARLAAEFAAVQNEATELMLAADQLVENGSFGAARAKYSRAIRKIGDHSELLALRETITEKLKLIRDRR